MFNAHRRYRPISYRLTQPEEELKALSKDLADITFTLCTAFRIGSLLLCNDSKSKDGVQEYAVFRIADKEASLRGEITAAQINSLTVSWMKQPHIHEVLATMLDRQTPETIFATETLWLDLGEKHRCRFCN